MVRAAAAAHRVLLERAQAGRGLARVEDRGARSLDGVDVATRQRCDAAQAREKIEGDALAGYDRARRTFDARDETVCAIPLADERLGVHALVERSEYGGRDRDSGDDARLLEQELGRAARVLRNDGVRR